MTHLVHKQGTFAGDVETYENQNIRYIYTLVTNDYPGGYGYSTLGDDTLTTSRAQSQTGCWLKPVRMARRPT